MRIKNFYERLRRAVWTYKQPLTMAPDNSDAVFSDLFIWRKSSEWETFFELMDMPGLFSENEVGARPVSFVFFDKEGRVFHNKTLIPVTNARNFLNISKLIDGDIGEYGTFAVFHDATPDNIKIFGSNLAERGYVSYRYREAPLRSYVHGNFDAIAHSANKSPQLMGGDGLRRREYHLQLLLDDHNVYEFLIVNTTSRLQKVVFETRTREGSLCNTRVTQVQPGGNDLFKLVPEHREKRIVIISRLIMARPLIFRIQDKKMDVFHG